MSRPVGGPKTPGPGAEPYIAWVTEILPAFGDSVWVGDPDSRRYHRVPSVLGDLLDHAQNFRTLDDHRRKLLQAGWQDDGTGYLSRSLRDLAGSGLLRSRTQVLAALMGQPEGEPPCHIASLSWVTRSRIRLVARSLSDHAEALGGAGRETVFRVCDDSPTAAECRDTREMLAELARRLKIRVQYAGLEEKRAFIEVLQRETAADGVCRETVEFALGDPLHIGYSLGANRNACLLGSAGEMTVLLDDDTACRFAKPPGPASGLALSARFDPTEIRFYRDRQSLIDEVPVEGRGVLAVHQALLGRTLADCLRSESGIVNLNEADTRLLVWLERHPGTVLLTPVGVHGESGVGSLRFVLGLTGPSRDDLHASERHYREAPATGQVLRAAPQATLTRGGLLMAMHCGVDHRRLLPPFLPVLRNEDGVFGEVVRLCRPDGLVGYLPLAAVHDPAGVHIDESRRSREIQLRVAEALLLFLRRYRPARPHSGTEQRLEDLGCYFRALASCENGELEESLRGLWVEELNRYAMNLEELLSACGGEPGYWARDVRAQQEAAWRLVEGGPNVEPVDLRGLPGGGAIALLRRLLTEYGHLLEAWPAIVDAAGRLRARGVTIGRRV